MSPAEREKKILAIVRSNRFLSRCAPTPSVDVREMTSGSWLAYVCRFDCNAPKHPGARARSVAKSKLFSRSSTVCPSNAMRGADAGPARYRQRPCPPVRLHRSPGVDKTRSPPDLQPPGFRDACACLRQEHRFTPGVVSRDERDSRNRKTKNDTPSLRRLFLSQPKEMAV